MVSAVSLEQNDQTLRIIGALTFKSVPNVRLQGLESINALSDIKVDLKDVTHTDSAGLVLLLEWLRTAQTLKKTLTFIHIPDQLLALANVSGVAQLFR